MISFFVSLRPIMPQKQRNQKKPKKYLQSQHQGTTQVSLVTPLAKHHLGRTLRREKSILLYTNMSLILRINRSINLLLNLPLSLMLNLIPNLGICLILCLIPSLIEILKTLLRTLMRSLLIHQISLTPLQRMPHQMQSVKYQRYMLNHPSLLLFQMTATSPLKVPVKSPS